MATFSFALDSSLPAAAVLDAATDFSERRPRLWPNIDPRAYRVHSLAAGRAEVTEGSATLGGVWARESYDWSPPGTVRATVQDSNVFQPGGTWELRATPQPGGGCRIEVAVRRQAKGPRGRLIGALMTFMGPKVQKQSLQRTLGIIAQEAPGPILSA
jgi:hypothetical protein